jgi:site-specific DNA-cytosine methylase
MREGKDGGGKGPLVSEDVSLTLATANGQVLIQPFVKIVRSGARDEDGELPPEVWAEREVSPTLNIMDNTGDSRATVLIFDQAHRGDGARMQGETIKTLDARMGTGGNNVPVMATQTTVRRLTPVECERLQGFPDNWTDGQTDGHRYKQMGNAVAVPVVEWIMARLVTSNQGDTHE